MIRALVAVVVAGVLVSTAAAQGPSPSDDRALPTVGAPSTVSRIEPRFSAITSRLAGKPIEVRCWNAADWSQLDGEWIAWTDGAVTTQALLAYYRKSNLSRLQASPQLCGPLVSFMYRNARPKNDTPAKRALVQAVRALSHETQHLIGHPEEDVAECYGMQRVRPVARWLGATKDYAAGLARLAWSRYPSLPEAYRSADCRNGGSLDLNPLTAVWP